MTRKKEFRVTVFDVHKYTYYVKADNAEEAQEKVMQGDLDIAEHESSTEDVEVEELKK